MTDLPLVLIDTELSAPLTIVLEEAAVEVLDL